MLNAESVSAVAGARLNQRFGKPIYDGYGFAQIPQTIRSLLIDGQPPGLPPAALGDLLDRYQIVVLCFIDSFGWRFVEKYADSFPFLSRIFADGVVSKLTTQFPSTTAAHVTTIHTGLPVGASGVYEWHYYEPTLGRLITPLLFSYTGENERETMQADGVDPRSLFPTTTLYQDLQHHGVASYLFQHRNYAFSSYTGVVAAGATIVPYTSLAEALILLGDHVLAQRQRAYYMLYYDAIDATCHRYGPESAHVDGEISLFLMAIERLLHARLSGQAHDTLLLLTADHGQMAISPATTFYLNREIPTLVELLRTGRDGQPLAPAGSSRDMFLYVRGGMLDAAHALLSERLAGRAEVYRVADLVAQGLFGEPSPLLLSRLGDLVILPYATESVWWYERKRFEQKFYGGHGGLSPEELETALLAYAYR